MSAQKFWLLLRLLWLKRVILHSVIIGLVLTLLITLVTLFNTGVALNRQGLKAIFEIAHFWFMIAYIVGFLWALVLSFKGLFNRNMAGYRLVLLECSSKEAYSEIILLDVLPLWRKFLFWQVWLISIMVLILLGIFKVDKSFFGGWTLFVWIILFGLLILKPLLLSMKNVRLRRAVEDELE